MGMREETGENWENQTKLQIPHQADTKNKTCVVHSDTTNQGKTPDKQETVNSECLELHLFDDPSRTK